MKTHTRQRPPAEQPQNKSDELENIPEDTRSKDEILQGCRKAIWARLDRITKALITQTLKKGSYLHARFLFDLVGLARSEEREPREDGSLVQLLLEKLEAPDVVGPDGSTDDPILDQTTDQSPQSCEVHTVE